jgi:hypothetical protein
MAGAPIVRLTATPLLLTTGAAQTLRMAGGGNRVPYNFGGVAYRAGVMDLPRFSCGFGWEDEGWTGGARPQAASISWAPSVAADLANYASLYMWKDAVITAEIGLETDRVIGGVVVQDGGEPASWTTLLTGTVVSVVTQDGALVFTIADNAGRMDKPIVTGHFAGTGNIEGPAEAEGREKRRSYGYVFNVEGRILDKANNIWEFGDPAVQLQSIVDVKDMGRSASPALQTVAYQGSIGATLAALQLANAAPGSGVVAPSIACVKWWTQPQGPLTADLIGVGSFGNTAITLSKQIATDAGLTMSTIPGTITSLMANTANAGLHVGDDRTTVAQALDRLLLGSGIFWRFSPAGTLDVMPIEIANPVAALRADVVRRTRIFLPSKTRRFGYKKNERVHSDSEISAALLSNNPNVLTADEKTRWLAGQAADLQGRYDYLKQRATALSLSTAQVDGARANWLSLLGTYSPPWNDNPPTDSVIYSTTLPDEGFPANWISIDAHPLAGQAANGVYTTLTDSSATDFAVVSRYRLLSAISNKVTNGSNYIVTGAAVVKKDSVLGSTRLVLLRVAGRDNVGALITGGYASIALDTSNGGVYVAQGAVFGNDWGVADLGSVLVVWATVAIPIATGVNAGLEFYPAIGDNTNTFIAAKTGSADVQLLPFANGDSNSLGRPLLMARLNIYSAALTALNKAISEVDGLTSIVVTGPPTITIQRDSAGAVKTGQLPALANYTAKGGNTDYTSLGTWNVTVLSGSLTASSPTAGQASVNTFTTPGKINVNFAYGPISRDFPVDVKAQDDPPTTSGGGGGGGGGGTTVNTTTLTDTTGTTYDLTTGTASKSIKLTVKTGPTGRIDLTAPIAFRRVLTNIGSTGAAGKFRWRVVGGSYADVATEQTSSADSDKIAGDPVEDGYLSVTMAKTGLTANTDYEIEFDWRQVNTSGTASTITRVSGVIQAVGS